jgi:hypothetical protein
LDKITTANRCLEFFDGSYTRIGDTGMASLSKLVDLESLFVKGTAVTDAGLLCFRESKLKNCDLSDCRISNSGVKYLSMNKQLEEIRVAYCNIDDDGIRELTSCVNCRYLDCEGTGVTDRGIKYICDNMKELIGLNASTTKITNESIKRLQGLRYLEDLALGGTSIDDNGVLGLCEMPSLKRVTLGGNRVSAQAFVHLKERMRNAILLYSP